jgi:hypothetical protein
MDADAAAEAIRTGDVDGLIRLLESHPGLANARIGPRTLLHVATDWPGHFPNGPAIVPALIARKCPVFRRWTHRNASALGCEL